MNWSILQNGRRRSIAPACRILISGAICPSSKVPTLFMRGAETDTFLEDAAKLVKRKQPRARVETLEKSTHLLPLERPQEVFDIMQSFLKETLKVYA